MVRILFALCLALALLNCSWVSPERTAVHIGVLAYRGPEKALSRWSPTVAYLQQQLPRYDFILIPLDLAQMKSAVAHGELEFVLTNTGNFYELQQYGLEPITSLRNLRKGEPYGEYGAVIFTHVDRNDIATLEDLKGKSFAAVSEQAFGGFQMAWRELAIHAVDPFTDFSELVFTNFPQDKVVHAVINKSIDAGTVRTDIIERMESEGQINASSIKIINQRKLEGFPFLLSTHLYPEWPFLKAQHTSNDLAESVRNLLVAITPDNNAAVAGHYFGWSEKNDVNELFSYKLTELMNVKIGDKIDTKTKYRPIDELMQELKIGPYQQKR